MSVAYRPIQWTAFKKRYDAVLAGGIIAYLAAFVLVSKLVSRGDERISDEVLVMRASATGAFVLLHVILSVGPLARLNKKFLPLLYNRRHLGVATFALAALHVVLAIGFYHGFGVLSPLRSVLTSNTQYRSISAFPFEIFGLFAFAILFLMAATSHDFWLKNLTPRVWKVLHMLVYPAWAALVLHVLLGALQTERSMVYPVLLSSGVLWICALHLLAASQETSRERAMSHETIWLDACAVDDLDEGRGKVVCVPGGERVALFRHGGGKISAVSNVCAHQAGPLGEGRIIDGCITCPWHGYQYRPDDGCAPPPFTEKLHTFPVRVEKGRVWIDPTPLPPGTRVEPATVNARAEASHA
jgi:nitrite reductase/ring-hydroxylating ferredoxin subunit/DMSO/TMAO reductase YedYZ heme-binding membrane subunit